MVQTQQLPDSKRVKISELENQMESLCLVGVKQQLIVATVWTINKLTDDTSEIASSFCFNGIFWSAAGQRAPEEDLRITLPSW